MSGCRLPVLFTVFNRPETTAQVFQAIRAARPRTLYVAADGPRDRPGEAALCGRVRELVAQVDWDCDLRTQFREQNLGCKRAMASAIDWFFENEPEGVIIEDDVLPQPTFWRYCEEMLGRYRDDARVLSISGSNHIEPWFRCRDSYYFSRFVHVWGWASWRRAWKLYDVTMRDWPDWRSSGGLRKVGGSYWFEEYWGTALQATYDGTLNTWDNQWLFAHWRHNCLSATSGQSQVANIGFGADATHTAAAPPEYVSKARPRPISFPLAHPNEVARSTVADETADKHVYSIGPLQTLRRTLRAVPVLGDAASRAKRNLRQLAGRIRRG